MHGNRKERKHRTPGMFMCEINEPSAVHNANSQQMQRARRVKYRSKELCNANPKALSEAIESGRTTGLEGDSCDRTALTLCLNSLQF
jgi:hypothetical protein